MKYLISIIVITIIFAYGYDYKIYDKGNIYYTNINNIDDTPIKCTRYNYIGNNRKKSHIEHSQVTTSKIAFSLNEEILKAIKGNNIKSKAESTNEYLNINPITNAIEIEYNISNSTRIKYLLIQGKVKLTASTNTFIRLVSEENYIWIGKIINNKIITDRIIVAHSRIMGSYWNNINISAIADINNDGYHEIIIEESVYEYPSRMYAISFDNKKMELKNE